MSRNSNQTTFYSKCLHATLPVCTYVNIILMVDTFVVKIPVKKMASVLLNITCVYSCNSIIQQRHWPATSSRQ